MKNLSDKCHIAGEVFIGVEPRIKALLESYTPDNAYSQCQQDEAKFSNC